MNKDMERYMHYLLWETSIDVSECRKLFLAKFPGQERFWDTWIHDWLD